MPIMDAHRAADDVHDFPLEKKAADADPHNVHWPLEMGIPTLTKTYAQPTPLLLVPRMPDGSPTTSSVSGDVSCAPNDNSGPCEKSASSSSMTLPIVLGVT